MPPVIRLLTAIVVALAVLTTVLAAQRTVTLVVLTDGDGKQRGGTQPRNEPYKTGAPLPLKSYLYKQKDVHDADGLAVSGFGFYVWNDRGNLSVSVFTLVPGPGAPNRYLADPGDPTHLLQPKNFATYSIKPGATVILKEMSKLGIKPMSLRIEAMTVK